MKLGVKVEGSQVVGVLLGLKEIANPARLSRAAVAAGNVLAAEMARVVRKKSGDLAADMGVIPLKTETGAVGGVAVGPKSPENFHRARLLQDGHQRKNKRTGAVSHIPGYQYAQPAVDNKGAEVEAVFAREITAGVKGLE